MVTKKEVWKKIKHTDIAFPLKTELFAMIDEYLDRIEFVKDHVGVRDFMFLAEKETHYTSDFFVAINVDCEKSYTYEKNLELFFAKYNDNSIKALKELVELFENTDRTLYIGFGFKDSEQFNEDEILDLDELLAGHYSTQEEILKSVRKFPDWYDEYAKDPNEIRFITVKAERYIEEVLKPLEKASLETHLNEILQKKNLKSSDKKLLKTIANHLAN